MELVIVSPVRTLYSGDAEEVSLPGTIGRFTVLPGHAPLISSLEEGDITYTSLGRRTTLAVKRGCVRILNDRIEACVETAGNPVAENTAAGQGKEQR